MQYSHAFEVHILLPKYLQLHKIGPHCVMSDNLLRSSPCYRPNTITLMALALIRQSLLITLLLDKVSNDDRAWHVVTWENLFWAQASIMRSENTVKLQVESRRVQ